MANPLPPPGCALEWLSPSARCAGEEQLAEKGGEFASVAAALDRIAPHAASLGEDEARLRAEQRDLERSVAEKARALGGRRTSPGGARARASTQLRRNQSSRLARAPERRSSESRRSSGAQSVCGAGERRVDERRVAELRGAHAVQDARPIHEFGDRVWACWGSRGTRSETEGG